jgi:hypothetical protein
MTRRFWKLAWIVLLAALAFMLMRMGEKSAAVGAPSVLTINAFLFLVGLSGALALLSPPSHSRYRVR